MFSSVKHSSLSQCGQKKLCNIWPNAQMKKKTQGWNEDDGWGLIKWKKGIFEVSGELKQTRQTVNPLALKIWQLPILIFI